MTRQAHRISLLGLGYLGCVSAACLARDGHHVIGIDVAAPKVDAINNGRSPVVEPEVAPLISAAVRSGRLRATGDATAIGDTDLSLICVGTPLGVDGRFDLTPLRRVCEQIGRSLRERDQWHTVVVRSTLSPGDTETTAIPAIEAASGKRAGRDFGVCYHPEFLREGTAVRDFSRPPRLVIGALDRQSGDTVAGLYQDTAIPIRRTTLRTAEMIKLVDNALHALKVSFANEIGRLCKAVGIDSHEVMRAVAEDARGDDAPSYLVPAFAFGGSCLPKDLRALSEVAAAQGIDPIVLRAAAESNESHKEIAFEIIRRSGRKRIGILGLSFKSGTCDLRDSPAVELAARLVREGCAVSVFDRHLAPADLHGANKAYADRLLPQLDSLHRTSLRAVLDESDLLVVAQSDPEFDGILDRLRPDQMVVDLVRLSASGTPLGRRYMGICW